MEQSSNHTCLLLRVSNYYYMLTLLQLFLTLSYLLALHHNLLTFSIGLQITIVLLIFVTLSIKWGTEREQFYRSKWNIIDIFILLALSISLFSTFIWGQVGFSGEMGAGFMSIRVIRYVVQIYRVVALAKVSKDLHEERKYQGMVNLKIGTDADISVNENLEAMS